MDSADSRVITRELSAPELSPLKCFLVNGQGARKPLKIINYHHKGACFQTKVGDSQPLEAKTSIKFQIGFKELKEKITYRIVWETIDDNGMFGVEFTENSSYVLKRAYRFDTHKINRPVIYSQDPLDPNRTVYFRVQNLSQSGLLLTTSMSNKHLFPGMELNNATINIPGMGESKVNLYIENCRPSSNEERIDFGVSIQNPSKNYIELASKYISNLATLKTERQRLHQIEEAQLLTDKLSKHLTIKVVKTEEEYEEVLMLRHYGYKQAGKLKDSDTYKDMGEGLAKEGMVLAAYLGGQLVASCEFRISKYVPLNITNKINVSSIDGLNTKNMSEINKLVVHPKAKGTDIVLGIFQKIHTIAIINGTPDGLILSEPKLTKLYERLGFQKKNVFIEHPNKPEIKLQVMLIKGDTYSKSEGMNPYAWSLAFELSHQFFSEIGLQKRINFSNYQQFIKKATHFYLRYFYNKKKSSSKKINAKNRVNPQTEVSIAQNGDSKWTKQHLNGTVLYPYILVSEETIGVKNTNDLLFKFGLNKNYFKKNSNWVSIEFFDSFLEEYSKHGDPYKLNRDAGYRATSKEILGANHFIMKHFFSPRVAFKAFEKYFPKFNKTRKYQVVESGINHCRIRIYNLDKKLLPKSHSGRENWTALLDAYVLVLTGRPANIEVLKSSFDGDEYCEYIVKWKNPLIKHRFTILTLSSLLLILASFYLLPYLGIFPTLEHFSITFLSFFLLFSLQKLRKFQKKYQDIHESMIEFENNADLKYRELQDSKEILEINYQESRLLDSINRKIQSKDDLSETLDIALENTCTQFGFQRAFIMILDEEKKSLRTSAVYGANETLTDLWKFSVDISEKRQNPALLSSVFHNGQSVIIDDVQSHLFQLNAKSQFLIKQLGVKSFTMVPIPSGKTNWGVLIADKGSSDEHILRRDLIALQRISQSIGLALDKKAKLDAEITARRIFQKYVPSWLVDNTLSNEEPKLGGVSKDALCLFMDIRSFTTISTVLPPEVLVEMLNEIFHILQQSVSKHNGVIDKFLGDGALITWGAYPGSQLSAQAALNAINEFYNQLQNLNKKLSPKGIPHIEVGFGIHKGPVIAGNVGSNERMEFTVIGSTVNVASRLEQLTKKYDAHIVVSDEVVDFKKLDENWRIRNNVSIRGLQNSCNIACFKFAS